MRQIGTLPQAEEARLLADHLVSLGIASRILAERDGWSVWVQNEDQVAQARQEFESFRQSPFDPRYQAAGQAAQALRRQSEQLDRQYRKNFRDLSGRWDGVNFRRRPLTISLIAISVGVYLFAQAGDGSGATVLSWLSFTSLEINFLDLHAQPRLGLQHILGGQVWRLITPVFIHFNPMHILFNMWWMKDLGSIIESRRGTKALLVLVVLSALASNVAEYAYEVSMMAIPGLFGGMSGVVYALFGYLWMKGRFDPEPGMVLHPSTVRWMILWLFICMTGALGPIANVAHVVGLIVGMLYGLARF